MRKFAGQIFLLHHTYYLAHVSDCSTVQARNTVLLSRNCTLDRLRAYFPQPSVSPLEPEGFHRQCVLFARWQFTANAESRSRARGPAQGPAELGCQPGLVGYRVYRSETWGASYTRSSAQRLMPWHRPTRRWPPAPPTITLLRRSMLPAGRASTPIKLRPSFLHPDPADLFRAQGFGEAFHISCWTFHPPFGSRCNTSAIFP